VLLIDKVDIGGKEREREREREREKGFSSYIIKQIDKNRI